MLLKQFASLSLFSFALTVVELPIVFVLLLAVPKISVFGADLEAPPATRRVRSCLTGIHQMPGSGAGTGPTAEATFAVYPVVVGMYLSNDRCTSKRR